MKYVLTEDEYQELVHRGELIEEKLTEELVRQEERITDLSRQAESAIHVLIQLPLTHEDLNACGCTLCESVRRRAIAAGYLEDR